MSKQDDKECTYSKISFILDSIIGLLPFFVTVICVILIMKTIFY